MSNPNASGWKPEMTPSEDGLHNGPATVTGNRALMLEEPLLFEIGQLDETGVDLPEPRSDAPNRLGGFDRTDARNSSGSRSRPTPSLKPALFTRTCTPP